MSRIWPLPLDKLRSIGQSVMTDRGTGRPHKGVDLRVDAGTSVVSSESGRVLRVVDGRESPSESQQAAGLWVDVAGSDGYVYRYLHLGSADVTRGQQLQQGAQVGTVAPKGTSGLKNSEPHLHFEIRTSDWQEDRQPWARKKGDKLGDYGPPMDPLKLLPPGLVRPRSAVAQVQDTEQQRPERVATSAPILPGKPDPIREQSAVVLSALSPADAARAFVGHREVKTAGPSGLVGGLLLIAAVWKTLRRRARA